jgi:hypothetical protein
VNLTTSTGKGKRRTGQEKNSREGGNPVYRSHYLNKENENLAKQRLYSTKDDC